MLPCDDRAARERRQGPRRLQSRQHRSPAEGAEGCTGHAWGVQRGEEGCAVGCGGVVGEAEVCGEVWGGGTQRAHTERRGLLAGGAWDDCGTTVGRLWDAAFEARLSTYSGYTYYGYAH